MRDNSDYNPSPRGGLQQMVELIPLLVILLAAAACFGAPALLKARVDARLKSERQKELARVAPVLLTLSDVPALAANVLIDQGEMLREACRIIDGTLNDENFVHGDAMEAWLIKYKEMFPNES
jgi:hypothetical protein